MKGRLAKTLHWGIVVSWVVIGAWFISIEISNFGLGYREFSMPELLRVRTMNDLLGEPFLTGVAVIAIFGTATSLYVLLRVIAARGPSLAAAILGIVGLWAFGFVAIRINFGIITFSSLLAPFALVLLSWMIHRILRSRTNSLPALGPFTLALMNIAFFPLYIYFLFGPRNELMYSELSAIIAFIVLIIFSIIGLIVFNWLWERGSGRSFVKWWRNPGSASGKKGPPISRGSRRDFLLVGIVLFTWTIVSLWMILGHFLIQPPLTDAALPLRMSGQFPTVQLAVISAVLLLGTTAAIAVLCRSLGSNRTILSIIFGLPALIGIGLYGLALLPAYVIYLGIIPFPIFLTILVWIIHRYVKYTVDQWTPTLEAFLLTILLIAYVPLFAYIVGAPVEPSEKYGIIILTYVGHGVALGIVVIALVRGIRFVVSDGKEKREVRLTGWPLRTRTPDWNPVASQFTSPEGFLEDGWTKGSATAHPVIKDGTVVVAENDGAVSAHEEKGGGRAWTQSTLCEGSPKLAIEYGSVYVAGGGDLTALSLDTGEQSWETKCESAAVGPPTPVEDSLYLAFEGGTLQSRAAKTGVEQWRTELDVTVDHPPSVANGLVYATTGDGSIVGVDCETGDVKWTAETDGSALSTPVVHAGTVYATDESGTVWFADAARGNELESTLSGVADARRPVVTDESILVTGPDEIVALNHAGEIRWDVDFAGIRGVPMVVGDTVLAHTDTEVFGLSLEMGQHRFSVTADGTIEGIAPTGEALYVATDAGLAAFPEASSAGDWGRSEEIGSESPVEDTTEREESSPDEADGAPAAEPEAPASVAEAFARDCDAVTAAAVVDDEKPVHAYDVRFADDAGEEDARCYVLSPTAADDPDAVAEFESIVRRWQSIGKNAHIATVYGSGDTPRPWVAFDPGDGRLDRTSQDLDREEGIDVIVDVSEAIRTANMYNINHGSLSLRCVFLETGQQDGFDATVADWGLTRRIETVVNDGSPSHYTAPEQRDDDSAGTQTDVFRLGVLAHQVTAAGEPLSEGDDLHAGIRRDDVRSALADGDGLPEEAVDVIAKAIDPTPDERFATAYDFQQRLLIAFE